MKKPMMLLSIAASISSTSSATVHAGSRAWSSDAPPPAIYQTNFWYGPTNVPALSATIATDVIANVGVSWGYRASTYRADPTYSLEAEVTAGGRTKIISANNKIGTRDINDPFWAGLPAKSTVSVCVRAKSSLTKVFVSPLSPDGLVRVTVNYTY